MTLRKGTTAVIGLMLKTEFQYVGLCYDGYPEHAGRVLMQSYRRVENLYDLLNRGNVYHLENDLNSCIFVPHAYPHLGSANAMKKAPPDWKRLRVFVEKNVVDFVYGMSYQDQEWSMIAKFPLNWWVKDRVEGLWDRERIGQDSLSEVLRNEDYFTWWVSKYRR